MKKILAVDGNSIVNRAFYGIRPLTTREGLPTNALFGMVNILERNLEVVKPDYCAIAFDLKAPTFRHELYDEYKAGRKPMPEELCAQMPYAKQTAKALGFVPLELAGYEADDILGTLAAMATREDCEAYILTGDRDALQLISDRVHVLLATNNDTVLYNREKFVEKYGVDPSRFVDVKALMGDSSDHIPGVPGIGEKTALKLIAEYGSLDAVYENLPTATLTPSVRNKLQQGRDSAFLSRRLAAIYCDVPICDGLASLAYEGIDRDSTAALFTKFEFHSFIKRFGLDNTLAAPSSVQSDVAAVVCRDIDALPSVLALGLADGTWLCSDGEMLWSLCDEQVARLVASDRTLVCHDAKSLYKSLQDKGIHWRSASYDTMLAAYVLNAGEGSFELSRIALQYLGTTTTGGGADLLCVMRLYHATKEKIGAQGVGELLYEIELPLAAVLADMELCGFYVNREGLVRYGEQLATLADELAERIYYHAGGEFNIQSPKQLGEVLFERLSLPHGKKTKTGYSTNADVLEKLRPYHPIIEDILDYRQVTKLNSTYAQGLLKQIGEDGRIHTLFKQTGTATGRLSSAEPNLQNIPIKTELGKELRRYFTAEKNDYVLIDADYSQIELRLLAALANDETMISAFAGGKDIHTSTAATVFGVPAESVTPELRKRAKAVNFGILYGMGAFSLSEDLHTSLANAKAYINSYFAAYPDIDQYLKSVIADAYRDGYVTTLFGRRRYIPELKMQNKNMQHFGERVAMNSPIQGTAADIIKIAMIRVDKRLRESGLDARLILQVHDELIVECHKDAADAVKELLTFEMEHAAALSVALKVEAATGKNWYDTH